MNHPKSRSREPWRWAPLAVLGILFCIELANFVIPAFARNYMVARATFQFDRYLDEGWVEAETLKLAGTTFAPITPKFRARHPDVYRARRGVIVTVLIDGSRDAKPYFTRLEAALTRAVVEKNNLADDAHPISISQLQVEPFNWFKALDLVSLLVLAGAIIAWIVLP